MKIKKHLILCHVIFRQTLLLACYFQANPAIGFQKKHLLQRLCANQLRLADLEAITRKHRIPAQKNSDYRLYIYVYVYVYIYMQ